MRPERARMKRRGAALVEGVLVTIFFVTLVFGMIDLSIALFRKHVVSEAARQGRTDRDRPWLSGWGELHDGCVGPHSILLPAHHTAIGVCELELLHCPGGRFIG